MVFAMGHLTKNNIKEIGEIFDRKFDEKLAPFMDWVQLEFQKVDQRFQRLEERFDQVFQKLDDFMFMYKKNDEQITMLASQGSRLNDRIDGLDERVVKLESQK